MYTKAHDIGLPASLVELRHEATHGDLPSLTILRSTAQRSLEWLYVDYWQRVAPEVPSENSRVCPEIIEKRDRHFRSIVRDYRYQAIRSSQYNPHGLPVDYQNLAEKACVEIGAIDGYHPASMKDLASILMEGFLICSEEE